VNILHVIPDLAPAMGGPVTTVLAEAEGQAALNQQVSVIATDYGLESKSSLDGVTIKLFACQFPPWRWSVELGRFLREKVPNCDIVHLHTLWLYPTWVASRACLAAGKPYVVTLHGMLSTWSLSQKAWKKIPYLHWVEGKTMRDAAAIHGTTKGELDDSRAERWNPSVFVLPLGLPRSAYADLPGQSCFADRFPTLENRRIILFLGRLHPVKQPEVVIRAFHQAFQGISDACLVMAGLGTSAYLRSLQRLVEALGIGSRVLFTGMLRGRAVQEAYRAASLFVLPSLHENFGVAAAEAMAAECPVVVSDRVKLAPEIQKAEAGFVTAPTVEATAEAMDILLRDQPLRISMGRNGRRLVLEQFTAEKVARDLLKVYEDIIMGCRRSPLWQI